MVCRIERSMVRNGLLWETVCSEKIVRRGKVFRKKRCCTRKDMPRGNMHNKRCQEQKLNYISIVSKVQCCFLMWKGDCVSNIFIVIFFSCFKKRFFIYVQVGSMVLSIIKTSTEWYSAPSCIPWKYPCLRLLEIVCFALFRLYSSILNFSCQ